MWKRTDSTAMAVTLTLLALALLLFSVMAMESIKATESLEMRGPSEHHKVNVSIRELLSLVGQSATIPPHVPVNKSCEPEDLPRKPTCSGHPGLTGKRLDIPRKIVLLFLFGFEADILEIALKQQHDMVDKIFLVESTQSHRGVT